MNESNLPPHRDPRVIDIPKFMPFFWLAVAVLSGIFVSNSINAHWSAWLVCASIGFVLWLLSVLFKKRRSDRLHLPFIWVLIIFFLAGMRYQIVQPLIDPTHSAYYNGRGLVEIVGVVTGPLETYDNHISLTVKVITLTPLSSDAYLTDPENVKGKLILQVPTGTDYHYGDKLTIEESYRILLIVETFPTETTSKEKIFTVLFLSRKWKYWKKILLIRCSLQSTV